MRRILPATLLLLVACSSQSVRERPHERNLLLVSADSLRADRLAPWRRQGGVEVPALERLAARGTLFEQMWAVSPWTAPSMVSIFTGLYPPSHGVAYRDDTTPRSLPTLARIASDAGYRVGNFSFFTAISYFRNLGFPDPVPGLAHGNEVALFGDWLDSASPAGRPFFAWLHLLHPHLPYGSSGYRAREVVLSGSSGLEASQLRATVPVGTVEFDTGDRERLLRLYDADVRELDLVLAELLEVLAARQLLESTVIVFVADHGEELLEDGWVGHASTSMQAKLRRELLHIPLLLAGPGVPAGRRSSRPTQHVDLLPTLASLLQLPSPPHLDGSDLFAPRGRLRRLLARLPWGSRSRRHLFFDSSLGGNLTPPERRTERLQGVSDGACLFTSHTLPEEERTAVLPLAADAGCDQQRLETALERWRRRQLEGRLHVLREHAEGSTGGDKELDDYAEELEVVAPAPGARLEWSRSGGQIIVSWEGEASRYLVEYDVGRPPLRLRGRFEVEQSSLAFGPFPEGFWNDLAVYNPFRFRVADAASRRRSAWHRFTLQPRGGEGGGTS